MVFVSVWLIASSVQFTFGQKISGVYSGKIGNENSVLQLKHSDNLLLGIVFKGLNKKWYFTAIYNGTGFSGNPTIGLAPDFFIEGTFKDDSVLLEIVAPDSTHIGKFKWVAKKNPEKIVSQVLSDIESLDPRLVGEWICINTTSPSNLTKWKITYLENGNVVLDNAYIKAYVEDLFRKHSVKQKVVFPRMSVTWKTTDETLIKTWDTEFGMSESIYTYKIKGDTLYTTGTTGGFTDTFIGTKKEKN